MMKHSPILKILIISGFVAFQIFNFATTEFALQDVSDTSSKWPTHLAIAFCLIDIVGISSIFSPERSRDEPAEVWYLFGAWFLAAAFNATLIWWGISVAILQNSTNVGVETTKVISVSVAAGTLLIRVFLINAFCMIVENSLQRT